MLFEPGGRTTALSRISTGSGAIVIVVGGCEVPEWEADDFDDKDDVGADDDGEDEGVDEFKERLGEDEDGCMMSDTASGVGSEVRPCQALSNHKFAI
jgi:hypothetical protein